MRAKQRSFCYCTGRFHFSSSHIIDIFNYRVNEGKSYRDAAVQGRYLDTEKGKSFCRPLFRHSYRKNVPAFKAKGPWKRSPLLRLFNDSVDLDGVSRN